jgi:hypothetical protein
MMTLKHVVMLTAVFTATFSTLSPAQWTRTPGPEGGGR